MSTTGGKCKTYIITDNGKRTLESVLLKQSQIALGINRLFESFMKDIFGSESLFITRPSIFALLETESIKQELEELEAKRESVLELLDSLQRYLAGLDAKIAELKRESTF
jgi:DNA-binding PadR family transcriptional regulator